MAGPRDHIPGVGAPSSGREGVEPSPEVGAEPIPSRESSQPQRERPERAADQFRQAGLIERFIRTIADRNERGGPQSFRLPGMNRMVEDRRHQARPVQEHEGRAQRSDHERSPSAMQIQEGKLQAVRERAYQNYLAERQTLQGTSAGPNVPPTLSAAEEKVLAFFFEKLLARFEGGEEQAREATDGASHFLGKTAAQWKELFMALLPRAEKKQVPLDEVADEMTFRGLLKKGNDPTKGVVIGDLELNNGTVEKFARFEVALQQAMAEMTALQPGANLSKDIVRRGVGSEMLEYIAIGPPTGEAEQVTAARDTQGMFTNLRTEAEIARQLGFAELGRGVGNASVGSEEQVARHRRGFGKLFDDKEEGVDDQPAQFVPWWKWYREVRYGQRKWFTAVTLVTLLTLFALGAWALLKFAFISSAVWWP